MPHYFFQYSLFMLLSLGFLVLFILFLLFRVQVLETTPLHVFPCASFGTTLLHVFPFSAAAMRGTYYIIRAIYVKISGIVELLN